MSKLCLTILCAISLLAFCVFTLNAKAQTWEEYRNTGMLTDDLADLEKAQEQNLESAGRYVHVPTFDVGDVSYSVTEYVTPRSEKGYQIIISTKDGHTISKGYGPEAESRTYEYSYIDNSDSVPTSTDDMLSE